MISLYRDLIKGNHLVKRFHLLIFYFHKSSNDAIAIVCIWRLILIRIYKKEATDEAPFSRNYSLNPLMNFEMTLVSYSPHVAKLLRINISKFLRLTGSIHYVHLSERSSRFARTASMYLSSSSSLGLDSLRTSSVYSFFPNGKNCIHCSRIHLSLAGSIHQEQ